MSSGAMQALRLCGCNAWTTPSRRISGAQARAWDMNERGWIMVHGMPLSLMRSSLARCQRVIRSCARLSSPPRRRV